MKTVGIVQARMSSSRLPGKVMKDLGGVTVIDLLLERASKSLLVDEFMVATTVNTFDDELVDYLQSRGISVFRGSELDVLDRFYECAKTIPRVLPDSFPRRACSACASR